MSDSFKFGGDVSAALGSQGTGMEGSTSANLGKDFVTYSRTSGLFAGVSVEGASIRTRDDLNKSYYGSAVRPTGILTVRDVKPNPRSQALRDAVVNVAGGEPTFQRDSVDSSEKRPIMAAGSKRNMMRLASICASR